MRVWEYIASDWRFLKRAVRQRWDRLSDLDLDIIAGRREVLSGFLQDRYRLSRGAVNRQIDEFCEFLDSTGGTRSRAGARIRRGRAQV